MATFNPTHDSYIRSGSSGSNYGSGNTFAVGYRSATADIARAVMKFDLSSIPSNATIDSATLAIYAASTDETESGNRTYEIHRNTSDFDESTVTWDSPPTFDAGVDEDLVITANTTGYKTFTDVISLVQNWVNGTNNNYGITIKVNNEASAPRMNYNSSEAASNKPVLTVTYSLPPTGNKGYIIT